MTVKAQTSIFSRLVAIAIAMATILVVSLWLVTDYTIRTTLEQTARDAVDVDLAGLVDIYASGGLEELELRIQDRLDVVPTDGSRPHYLLQGSQGQRLAGDIDVWPKLDAEISESGEIALGESTQAFARATLLAADLRLLVAHETAHSGPLRRSVALAFLIGGALFLVLVGSASRLAASRLGRRIDLVNTAFQCSDFRALSEIETAAKPDEVDELTAHSAAALQRVSRLMEAYRDTSDQVAHEIRTPLMHLDGRLAKALNAKPGQGVAKQIAEGRKDIRDLVAMLEGLLDIAASNARRGDLGRLKNINLSELCERICELYADSAEESKHVLTWSIAPEIKLDAEEDQIARLITNLLDNALKYVPSGGRIQLILEEGPVLIVQDDGPGIPAADKARIFDRFYRGSAEGMQQGGAGLGLALARAIANRHNLTITLDPDHDGAKFVVQRGEA